MRVKFRTKLEVEFVEAHRAGIQSPTSAVAQLSQPDWSDRRSVGMSRIGIRNSRTSGMRNV